MATTQLDDIKIIRSFLTAANTGSFTKAAEALSLTPSAVSKNVSALEKSLGVRLFNRTTRSLSLTAEGLEYSRQAQAALDLLLQAGESLRFANAEPVGKVRISLPVDIGHLYVIPFLEDFKAKHPQINFELDFENRIIDFVSDGFDFVIRGGTITDTSLIARRLGKMELSLMASPKYLAARGTPQSPADFSKHDFILRKFASGKIVYPQIKQEDGAGYIAHEVPNPFLLVSDPYACIIAALSSIGITYNAKHLAKEFLATGQLVEIMPEQNYSGHFELTIQYPHRSYLAPRVRLVIDYLVQRFAEVAELHQDGKK
ncbi:LysR family transcriptional regulator [Psittacicella hinzii]|uniref:HTH lysR-type domain-containing protein n=1 Tax=Psittacicella hinzii TaxID=2028575 RepID=A0A3A1YSE9_9GAMM|nr:LysR family transcriptional regulator [Psittacicella hinzii]RIY40138.1 hypothetical protein CKF58_00980 [Psittacicella hinzii]